MGKLRLRRGRPPASQPVAKQEGYLASSLPAHWVRAGHRRCSGELTLTSLATPVLPMLLRRLLGKGGGAGLGARLGMRLGVRDRGWPSQYSEGAVELPGRPRRSSRLWLPRSG